MMSPIVQWPICWSKCSLVLYDDPRPTFEAAVVAQNKAAAVGKQPDLQGLLNKGQTWTVTEDGPEL